MESSSASMKKWVREPSPDPRVNRLRLQRADELHRQEPQAPIGDIIARSGFDSPSNYYKAKRKYGE